MIDTFVSFCTKKHLMKLCRFVFMSIGKSQSQFRFFCLQTGDPVVVVSLIEELVHRNALQNAIGNRTAVELEPILVFVRDYLLSPRYNTHLFLLFEQILDRYSEVFGR